MRPKIVSTPLVHCDSTGFFLPQNLRTIMVEATREKANSFLLAISDVPVIGPHAFAQSESFARYAERRPCRSVPLLTRHYGSV